VLAELPTSGSGGGFDAEGLGRTYSRSEKFTFLILKTLIPRLSFEIGESTVTIVVVVASSMINKGANVCCEEQ
jgi:hypothetical protein